MELMPYVAGRLWLCTYPVRLAGTRFSARMTVIRLDGGELVLHSPCAMDAAAAGAVSALGPVAHIVAPGNFHGLHVAAAQAAFPQAKTWICPGLERRQPGIRYDAVLGDAAPSAWAGEIEHVAVRGTRVMREVAMFHRDSRTLILVDLIENFTDATPGTGGALKFWFKYVLRMWNRPRPAPEYRIGRRDRAALAESLQRILAWDFRRIVVSHGDTIEEHARDVAVAAWRGLLG